MSIFAPLRVTVEIHIESGIAAGERRFRLSNTIELPPKIWLDKDLPVVGETTAKVFFDLPEGPRIEAAAKLHFDSEHPDKGSQIELIGLTSLEISYIENYIEKRLAT